MGEKHVFMFNVEVLDCSFGSLLYPSASDGAEFRLPYDGLS